MNQSGQKFLPQKFTVSRSSLYQKTGSAFLLAVIVKGPILLDLRLLCTSNSKTVPPDIVLVPLRQFLISGFKASDGYASQLPFEGYRSADRILDIMHF